MSASASNSKSEASQTTESATGASGNESPTITAGGSVVYTSDGGKVSISALEQMKSVISKALDNSGSVNSKSLDILSQIATDSIDAQTNNSDTNAGLLATVLGSNYQLAQNSQTGGATAAIKSTNYIIWGLLAIGGLLLGLVFFRKT